MSTLSAVTAALERAWAAIRTVYPSVRPAAMVVYLDPRADRRGHYHAMCWTERETRHRLDEVHISSHVLEEGAQSVLHTLLHESIHSSCFADGVQETSRQGRWHNNVFRAIAQQRGLLTAKDPTIGTITTGLHQSAYLQFGNVLQDLETAIELFRGFEPRRTKKRTKAKGLVKLECPVCKRIIRASAKTQCLGPIICEPCGATFIASI